ncbi:hypothetical protein N7G274_007002 [Stereocaulon virgatum]|uniref:Uncharacterized protein n=1 Tax=Stereocaulon virgatum TaxID=373712 RepID=A0ABR4A5Q7_9LECA
MEAKKVPLSALTQHMLLRPLGQATEADYSNLTAWKSLMAPRKPSPQSHRGGVPCRSSTRDTLGTTSTCVKSEQGRVFVEVEQRQIGLPTPLCARHRYFT